jgi:hypothetical protein
MPLSSCTTPANGDERAQGIPLLDTLHVRPGQRGRPRKRCKVLAAEKGYEAKDLRRRLRTRGIRPQIPTRVWKSRRDGQSSKRFRATKPSGRLPGSNGSTAAWLSAGSVWPLASMRFSPWR